MTPWLTFLDTNVRLALVWERHIHSVLRLFANRAVMGKDVLAGAWDVYDQCCIHERIAFLPEPDGVDPRLRVLAKGRQSSPNVWADAYLAAFAAAAKLRLITFDKALAAKSVECLVLK